MSKPFIRTGYMRDNGYSKMYNEIWDFYHPYIGDKATFYYLFLLRHRHNKEDDMFGKSWNGRRSIVNKMQLSYSTLPLIDGILKAFGLIEIELEKTPFGDKIYYTVNDVYPSEHFLLKEQTFIENLKLFLQENEKAITLIGKEKRGVLL